MRMSCARDVDWSFQAQDGKLLSVCSIDGNVHKENRLPASSRAYREMITRVRWIGEKTKGFFFAPSINTFLFLSLSLFILASQYITWMTLKEFQTKIADNPLIFSSFNEKFYFLNPKLNNLQNYANYCTLVLYSLKNIIFNTYILFPFVEKLFSLLNLLNDDWSSTVLQTFFPII